MTIFSKQNKALSAEMVIEARTMYFIKEEQYRKIHQHINKKYNLDISISLVKKAVQGQGGYASIKDDIPQEKKDQHIPAHIKYSLKRAKATYYSGPQYQHLKDEREAKALYRKSAKQLKKEMKAFNSDWNSLNR